MIFSILRLSLIIVCFCLEIGFFPVLNTAIVDYRVTKVFLALFFAGLISILTLQRNAVVRQISPWPGILLFYLLIHPYLAPDFRFPSSADQIIAGLWKYKPMTFALVYYFFFLSIQKILSPRIYREKILAVLMWIGFITSIYVFIQFIGLDSFQHVYDIWYVTVTTAGNLSSFFTHPNYSANFMAMCLPAAYYFRRWWFAASMILAIILCQSWFAIGATIIGSLFYLWYHISNWEKPKFIFAVLVFASAFILALNSGLFAPSDSGRFSAWQLMFNDTKPYAIFGHGFGAFPILFPAHHPVVDFVQAHNELFQFGFDCGIVGMLLLLAFVVDVFKKALPRLPNNEILICLTTSFVIIVLCAQGQFIFQIEPHRYVSVIILGCIMSTLNKKESLA